MKPYKIILLSLLMSIGTGMAVYFLLASKMKKTVVVDAVRLFNEYHMKLELEQEVDGRLKYYGHIIDSLEQQIRLYKNIEEAPQTLIRHYRVMKQELEADYTESNRSINEQVWKRLNPLIEKYGKSHNLHLIIGANGMGSVLYNDDYYDKTDELIRYVNDKYEGK